MTMLLCHSHALYYFLLCFLCTRFPFYEPAIILSAKILMCFVNLLCEQVEVRGNDSRIHAEMDFSPNISTIVLNNLTLG